MWYLCLVLISILLVSFFPNKFCFYKIFLWVTAFYLIIFVYITVVGAFIFPLELEVREGLNWLHVAALKAGVNIFDSRQVDFVQINMGPFDSLFKVVFAFCLPFLPPPMIIRLPVFLLPFLMVVVSYLILKKDSYEPILPALLGSALMYIFFLHTTTHIFKGSVLLVGRGDATAILLTVCLMGVLHGLWKPEKNRLNFWLAFLSGLLSGAVVLTKWLFLPLVGVLFFLTLVYFQQNPGLLRKDKFLFLGGYFSGIFLLFVLIFLLFGPALIQYYLKYASFFGQGEKTPEFWLSPWLDFIYNAGYQFVVPIFLLVFGLLVKSFWSKKKEKWLDLSWGVVLTSMCLATFWSYYFNYSGGWVYYYLPFFLLLWFFGLCYFSTFQRFLNNLEEWLIKTFPRLKISWKTLIITGAIFYVIINIDWYKVVSLTKKLWLNMKKAHIFLLINNELCRNYRVRSEIFHLYKKHYDRVDLVDSGDVAERVFKWGGFGVDFQDTYRKYQKEFIEKPPDFIVKSKISTSDFLQEFIVSRRYQLFLVFKFNWANEDGDIRWLRRPDL